MHGSSLPVRVEETPEYIAKKWEVNTVKTIENTKPNRPEQESYALPWSGWCSGS
jgi:hypothetical protein